LCIRWGLAFIIAFAFIIALGEYSFAYCAMALLRLVVCAMFVEEAEESEEEQSEEEEDEEEEEEPTDSEAEYETDTEAEYTDSYAEEGFDVGSAAANQQILV
jgi:hypothetical protein